MPNTVSYASRALTRCFVLFGLLLLCFLLLFVVYVWAEKQIDQANAQNQQRLQQLEQGQQ